MFTIYIGDNYHEYYNEFLGFWINEYGGSYYFNKDEIINKFWTVFHTTLVNNNEHTYKQHRINEYTLLMKHLNGINDAKFNKYINKANSESFSS